MPHPLDLESRTPARTVGDLRRERVIVHIDLDCFYAQVERVRLAIPGDTPLAVQQWRGLIAVDYNARKCGITRHETVDAARQKCPQLRLVHVATYKNGEKHADYYPDPKPSTHKVSLDPYRYRNMQLRC